MTKFWQNVQSQKKPFVPLKIFGAQHLRNLSAGKSKTCCLRVRESERERESLFIVPCPLLKAVFMIAYLFLKPGFMIAYLF